MIVRNDQYPRSADVAKHGGAGEFGVETILGREQLGKAGRLFVRGTLKPGHSVGMHSHNGDMEICYFLSGTGLVREDDGREYLVHAGDTEIVPSGHAHEIVCQSETDDLIYIAIVIYPEERKQN